MSIAIIFVIVAIALGAIASFLLLAPLFPAHSSIDDSLGDASATPVFIKSEEPVVQDYHDIVSASVQRLNGEELLLTVEVAGDPNLNLTYETVYIWIIDYPSLTGSQRYTIVIPNFPSELGVQPIGWHAAIFDNNANRWVVPLRSIAPMEDNKVEINIDPEIIGSPPFLWWQVYVMVGVDPQSHETPDFVMDFAPDSGANVMLVPFT